MASAAPEKAGGLLATISAMFGTGNFLAVVITFFVVAVAVGFYVLASGGSAQIPGLKTPTKSGKKSDTSGVRRSGRSARKIEKWSPDDLSSPTGMKGDRPAAKAPRSRAVSPSKEPKRSKTPAKERSKTPAKARKTPAKTPSKKSEGSRAVSPRSTRKKAE